MALLPELGLTLWPAVCLWGLWEAPLHPHCVHLGKESNLPVPQFPRVLLGYDQNHSQDCFRTVWGTQPWAVSCGCGLCRLLRNISRSQEFGPQECLCAPRTLLPRTVRTFKLETWRLVELEAEVPGVLS